MRHARRSAFPWSRTDTLALTLITIFGGLLRFVRLASPKGFVFDETYYAKDACLYLGLGQSYCRLDQATEQSYVHPPLGKWLIAIGERLFGYNEFGWRVASAVVGTALIVVIYLLARKLFHHRWIAGAAALLTATDFLLLVQSRIAMLDIFQSFFVALGFLFLAYDRADVIRWRSEALLPFPAPPRVRELEWRFAAGASFGLALGVKWSAAWALIGAASLAAIWSISLIRAGSRLPGPKKRGLWEALALVIALGVIPVAAYLSSYTKYFVDTASVECPYRGPKESEYGRKPVDRSKPATDLGRINFGVQTDQCKSGPYGVALAFIDLQGRMANYHLTLNATHAYKSSAASWPIVRRPVAYYFESKPEDSQILAFGNPAVWWAALAGALLLLSRSLRPRAFQPERVVAVAWASQYLPWLAVTRPLFFFYMTPVAPFMMIGLAVALEKLRSLGRGPRWLVTTYFAIGVMALLWYFYPVIAAVGLRPDLWRSRMWFRSWI
ncbi:MAG TPA: phospholipid carrier-dependent glycosyltransferase [Actinomycetota bacterium]|nr:phospholipid carrier-dependent glycosyltransferase [Actinomycetota bacterium]